MDTVSKTMDTTINQPPPEPLPKTPFETSPAKKRKYLPILLAFLVILFILAPLVGFYLGSTHTKKSPYLPTPQKQATSSVQKIPTTAAASPSSEILEALSIPPYTSPWKELSASDAANYGKDILYFTPTAKKWSYEGRLSLKGKGWQRIILHKDEDNPYEISGMQKIGDLSQWNTSLTNIPIYDLFPLSASGPCGDIEGSVGHYGKYIRVFTYWYSVGTCKGDGGGQIGNSPYDTYVVFISDIYNENQILELTKTSEIIK